MNVEPQTSEERLSRLEGVYQHLATKADVAELKADIAELKAELKIEIYKGLTRNLYITIVAVGVAVTLMKYL